MSFDEIWRNKVLPTDKQNNLKWSTFSLLGIEPVMGHLLWHTIKRTETEPFQTAGRTWIHRQCYQINSHNIHNNPDLRSRCLFSDHVTINGIYYKEKQTNTKRHISFSAFSFIHIVSANISLACRNRDRDIISIELHNDNLKILETNDIDFHWIHITMWWSHSPIHCIPFNRIMSIVDAFNL